MKAADLRTLVMGACEVIRMVQEEAFRQGILVEQTRYQASSAVHELWLTLNAAAGQEETILIPAEQVVTLYSSEDWFAAATANKPGTEAERAARQEERERARVAGAPYAGQCTRETVTT